MPQSSCKHYILLSPALKMVPEKTTGHLKIHKDNPLVWFGLDTPNSNSPNNGGEWTYILTKLFSHKPWSHRSPCYTLYTQRWDLQKNKECPQKKEKRKEFSLATGVKQTR